MQNIHRMDHLKGRLKACEDLLSRKLIPSSDAFVANADATTVEDCFFWDGYMEEAHDIEKTGRRYIG